MIRGRPIHPSTLAAALALLAGATAPLAGCGGSTSESAETVPEPVAVSPEATEGGGPADLAVDEGVADEVPRPDEGAVAAATPPDESEGEQPHVSSAQVQGQLRLDLSNGRLQVSASGADIHWWAIVRAPGGAEQRFDLDRAPFDTEVAGWRCRVGSVRAQQQMRITNGTRSSHQQQERVLLCSDGSQRRTAVGRCRVDDDGSGSGPQQSVTPAELDLGDPADPHEITLSCAIR